MTYKKLKTVTFTVTLTNGKEQDIKLPANYQIIFDSVTGGTAGYATARLYDTFVSEYGSLSEFEKEKYRHIANSGRVRTDEMCDLVNIFHVMDQYLCIENVNDFEDLGRLYASIQMLECISDATEDEMALRYAELGRAVCDETNGFFVDNKFYCLMCQPNPTVTEDTAFTSQCTVQSV